MRNIKSRMHPNLVFIYSNMKEYLPNQHAIPELYWDLYRGMYRGIYNPLVTRLKQTINDKT